MNRLMDALSEWLQLRERLRNEHQFHLDRQAADLQAFGLSRKAAYQAARARFGSRRHLQSARKEIGADWAALPRLFLAHRVHASPWFHPALLAITILFVPLLSPAPVALIEGVIGHPLTTANRNSVFVSEQKWNLNYIGITKAEFESIQSLNILSKLERYQSIHARAQLKKGVTIAAIQSLVLTKTGNPRLRVVPLFERQPIVMGPAKVVWGFMGACAFLFLASFRRSRRWLGYGMAMVCLHALASLLIWALAIKLWSRISWSTDGRALFSFLALFLLYLALIVLQGQVWWHDLRKHCPFCFEILLLPLTEGSSDSFLLNSATKESICAHGHGVLVESKWSSRFRQQQSPLHGLIHG